MLYIGIDPDVDKNGVAIWNSKSRDMKLSVETFFDLFEIISSYPSAKVIIEAGWLNKSNFHVRKGMTTQAAAKTGLNVGRNQETGMKIEEMCKYLGNQYQLIKPTRSKLNADQFRKITKYQGSTNQEKRDAGMLVFGR